MRVLQIIHGNEAGGVKTLSEIIGDGLSGRGVAVETVVMFAASGVLAKLGGAWRIARTRLERLRVDPLGVPLPTVEPQP